MRDHQQGGSRGSRNSRSKRRSQPPEPDAAAAAPTAEQLEYSTFEVYIQRPLEHVSSFFNNTAATLTATASTTTATPTATCCNRPPRETAASVKEKRSSTKTIATTEDGGSDDSLSRNDDSVTGCSLPEDYSAARNKDDLEDGSGVDHGDNDNDDDLFPPPMSIVDPIGQKNIRIRRLRRHRCILLIAIIFLGVLALILGGLLGRSKRRHQQQTSSAASQTTTGSPKNNSSQPVPTEQPTDTNSSSTTDTTNTTTGVTPPSSPSTSLPSNTVPGTTDDSTALPPPVEEYPEDVVYFPAPDPDTVPAVPSPSPPSTTTTNTTTSSSSSLNDHCGCSACTDEIWNGDADSFTCGERISWLHESFPRQYMTVQDACRRIAFEFPSVCAGCDPARCNWIPETPFVIPEGDAWTGPDDAVVSQLSTEVQNPATLPDLASYSLYCFPDIGSRTEYEMWDGMKVQVKRDPAGTPCGPGDNIFSESTVAVDGNTDELTLKYINGQASEVRILLPASRRPYTYGNYAFSVKSISVKNAAGQVISTQLPKELVLGMFTWDDSEDYASHQNYNHEVDIEISRWNHESNADVQFLVQPPGAPQQYRFFSGQADASTDDMEMQLDHSSPNWYNFTWLPGRIDWSSTAGRARVRGGLHDYTLTTEEALYKGVTDYVQCMPGSQNVEVRINLWNMLGSVHPVGLATTDVVEVVFDKVSYEPASSEAQLFLADGEFCSKSCQCSATSRCFNAKCTAD